MEIIHIALTRTVPGDLDGIRMRPAALITSSSAAGRLYASAVTGYQQLDGAVYYFEDDGRMLVDDTTPDGRFADVDGKLLDQSI